MELKPIGTEYWQEYPVSVNSTENCQHRFLYKVTGHVLAMRFIGDKVGRMVESVEPIKHEIRDYTSVILNNKGEFDYSFEDWRPAE